MSNKFDQGEDIGESEKFPKKMVEGLEVREDVYPPMTKNDLVLILQYIAESFGIDNASLLKLKLALEESCNLKQSSYFKDATEQYLKSQNSVPNVTDALKELLKETDKFCQNS